MTSVSKVVATDWGLASELRLSVLRLRRRLTGEGLPHNELSPAALAVIGCLYRFGEMTIGELAQHERVQPPSMTRTVRFLESSGGFVERRPHPDDRRQVLVRLTEAGRQTLLADRESRDAWLAQRLSRLTQQERDVLRQAAPLLDRLATDD